MMAIATGMAIRADILRMICSSPYALCWFDLRSLRFSREYLGSRDASLMDDSTGTGLVPGKWLPR
jgi:hypothetical protein